MIQVSVIIPAYNAEAWIAEALTSVSRQLPEGWEVIVVNDGSEDRTPQVVARFKEVTLIEGDAKGVTAAREKGVLAARGEYLFFMDADDLLPDGALDAFQSTLDKYPSADLIVGDTVNVFRDSSNTSPYASHDISSGNDLFDWIVDCRTGFLWGKLIRKTLFLNLPLMPYDLRFCEDYTQMLQLATMARECRHTGRPGYCYRQNPDSACNRLKSRTVYADNFLRFALALESLTHSLIFDAKATLRLEVMFLYYMRLYLWVAGSWNGIDPKIKKRYTTLARKAELRTDKLYTPSRRREAIITGAAPWLPAMLYVPLLRHRYHRIK